MSIVLQGHSIELYSYEPIRGVPAGVTLRAAGEVADPAFLDAFIYQGQPSLSHFSDYFRYRLFSLTDRIWIDTDMLMLRPVTTGPGRALIAQEAPRKICGAIMHLPKHHPALPELLRRTEDLIGRELIWGATGPRLLNQLLLKTNFLTDACDPDRFYPIHHVQFWKVFLPEYADECAVMTERADTVHLWNNLVTGLGYWKDIAPPDGSFLWRRLREQQLLPLFRDTYPTAVMRSMVTNWRFRLTGRDLTFSRVARQLLPSLARSWGSPFLSLSQRAGNLTRRVRQVGQPATACRMHARRPLL